MTKIMLVEDDKSLREIYGVRLLAEGYDIVSAGDGEEALAMAIKERPALIVSDVMMPKISGFDMLDILRSTTETKSVKVIMMTALSSDEQRQRGESLGADRYLVKSQVGIEDVVRVVHEVLGDSLGAAPAAVSPQPVVSQQVPQVQTQAPVQQPQSMQAPTQIPVNNGLPTPGVTTQAPVQPQQPHTSNAPAPPSSRNRIIQPLSSLGSSAVDINDLVNKELAKEAGIAPGGVAPAMPGVAPLPQQQPAPEPISPSPAVAPNTLPDITIGADGRVISPGSFNPPIGG